MVVADVPMKTKYVFAASAPGDECVRHAQVVIVAEHSWHLIAPKPYRVHCLLSFAAVPSVACPVVDVRGVKDDVKMFAVMQACVDEKAGVLNLDGLLTGLEALGGVVKKAGKKKAGVK